MFRSSSSTLAAIWWLPAVAILAGCASAPVDPVADPVLAGRYADAVALQQAGQLAGAEQGFSAIAVDYPARVEPRISLALVRAAAGDAEEAERMLEAVVADFPDNAVAWSELGILHRLRGRLAAADAAYARALAVDPDYALAHRNRGVLLDLYLGRPDEALAHYRRYVQIAGGDEEVESWIAELELRVAKVDGEMMAEQR